ncbi:hypothetical protein CLOP_g470, partial [Closterium sp. NIES-67]
MATRAVEKGGAGEETEGDEGGRSDGCDDEGEDGSLDMEPMDLDECLRNLPVVAAEEVVQRRLNRLRKLMAVYRGQYWALLEELRAKYRRFYMRTGQSGWKQSAPAAGAHPSAMGVTGGAGEGGEFHFPPASRPHALLPPPPPPLRPFPERHGFQGSCWAGRRRGWRSRGGGRNSKGKRSSGGRRSSTGKRG